MKIYRDRFKNLLTLLQESYIEKILDRFHLKEAKPVDTPIANGESLSFAQCPQTPSEKESMKVVPYSYAVGSLMYAILCTRLDLVFAVGLVSRY